MRFNTILDLTRQSRIDLGATAQFEGSILLNENFTLQGNGYFTNIYTGSVNDSILSISSAGLVQKIQLEDKLALFLKAGAGIDITPSPGALTITNTGVIAFNGRKGLVVPASGDYNTDIVPEGFTNKYYTDTKVSTFINSISNIAGGLLKLNSNTKIDEIYLPRLAITEVFVVADITEMLTLTAQEGDVAKVLSNDTAYILKQEPASDVNNWIVISGGGSTDTLQTVMSRSNLTTYDLIFNGQNTISTIKNNNGTSSLFLQSNTEIDNSASISLFGETSIDYSKSLFLNIGSVNSSITDMENQSNGVSLSVQANSTSGSNKIFVLGVNGNLLLSDNLTSNISFAQYKLEVKDEVNSINAKFWGRVIGSNAVNNNEFLTLGQGDSKYSLLGHTHEWSTILNRPTKLSQFINDLGNYGNWITKAEGDTYYSSINHTHTFASITNKPTTLAGYGIIDGVINSRTITAVGNGITGGGDLSINRTFSLDFTYLDGRYALTTNLSNYYTKLESDGRYKALSYVPTWAEILNKPTTILGYGITDANLQTITTNGNVTNNYLILTGSSNNPSTNTNSLRLGYINSGASIAGWSTINGVTGALSLFSDKNTLSFNGTTGLSQKLDMVQQSASIAGAQFNTRVSGSNAINTNEFLTLGQINSLVNIGVTNVSGVTQFNLNANSNLSFEGTGDTTISFDPAINKVTITSIPGSGTGGAVTSFNGRTGGVTSQLGDYSTAQVTEVTNLYFTNARVKAYSDLNYYPLSTNPSNYLTSSALLPYALKDGSNTSGLWPISITGNAATATNSTQWNGRIWSGAATGNTQIYFMTSNNAGNWYYSSNAQVATQLGLGSFAYRNSINGNEVITSPATLSTDIGVATYLRWNNYGNGHVIFDASKGIAPNGSTIPSNTNSQNTWIPTHPTLMGWNGTQTYGVRVDMARQADVWANAGSYINTDVAVNTYMMGLGADGNWHPIGKTNLGNFLGEVTPVINSIVKRDVNGYIEANFLKSTASAQAPQSSTPSSLYGNAIGNDGFHYSYTNSAVRTFLGLGVLATNQADITTVYDVAPTGNRVLGMGTDGLVHVYSPTGIQTWLGLIPGNYVRKSPLSITNAGTADNQINNLVTFAYNTSGSQWTGALMSIGGFNGGNYDLQLNGDYSINELSFRNRNGDNNTWGSWKRVLYQGFTSPAVLLGGVGTSYQNATLQLQHTTTPPNLSFHYAGVVASQITIEQAGRIAIMDNPGLNYEALAAAKITASGGFKSTSFLGMTGDYDTNTTANKIIWTIGDQWNTIAALYGLGYSYNSSFRTTMHQIVVSLAGVQNISLGMDGDIRTNGPITSAGLVVAGTGTNGGFENTNYSVGHNNIWRLQSAREYGLAYYQGGDSGNDIIGMHFGARATAQHKFGANGNAIHTGSVTAGKTIIGQSDEQVRMIGDNPFISWNRNNGVRIGYIQGTGSGNLAIQSETGPLSLGATGGVIVNSNLTVNGDISNKNYIYSAVDGTAPDVYGIISVTRGTASSFAYFGMTRAGQAGYSMGIDTGNRMIWGVGAGGGVMSTLAYLDLAGRFGTVSNIAAGGTLTGAGIGLTQTAGTGQGISLYNGSGGNTIPTYGLLFGLTSSFGTHGSVTGDFATYFTLDGTANRGWVFRTVSGSGTNVASIGATGNMNLNGSAVLGGSLTAAGGGFNSHRNLKKLYDFDELSISGLDLITSLSIRKFSYLNNLDNISLGLIIDEIPEELEELLLVNNDSIDLYTLHSLSVMAHKQTKIELDLLKKELKELKEIIKNNNGI